MGNVGKLLAAVLILAAFLLSLSRLEQDRQAHGAAQLEATVRRAAVACYAAEGMYPDDISYLQEHYGVQIDEERYTVIYDVFASNLMPDITALEND